MQQLKVELVKDPTKSKSIYEAIQAEGNASRGPIKGLILPIIMETLELCNTFFGIQFQRRSIMIGLEFWASLKYLLVLKL